LFAGLDTLACLGAWMMVAGGLGLAGVASYQLMPDQIKADAGRAIDALVTDLTRGPEAIYNTAGAGPQIDASPALGYPLGPVRGAGTGGGYPLAGESGALRLTTPLQGSATVSLKDPLQAKITDRPSGYRKGVREAVEAKASTDESGRKTCWGCGQPMPKIQLDHHPPIWRRVMDRLFNTRQEFLDDYNNVDEMRPLCPTCNMSHRFENTPTEDLPYYPRDKR